MTSFRKYAAVLLATMAAAAAVFSIRAQPQGQTTQLTQPPGAGAPLLNSNLVVLDPAHGGPDPGATLGDRVFEKDITVAFAARLRTALTAAGFTVVATRDAESTDPLNNDQRAEIANRTHAIACIVLHATATGSGLHIFTSALQQSEPDDDASGFVPVPWDMAQAAYANQSQTLAGAVGNAAAKDHLPQFVAKATVRPLDNLMCPAVAVEIAPLRVEGGGATAVSDGDYQQRAVGSLVAGLRAWRDQVKQAQGVGQ